MGWRTRVRRLAASLTLKLVILVGIFIALPIILYGQFESADRQMRQLVTRAIEDRSQLIADALKPLLQDIDPTRQVGLNADLGRYSSDGTVLKLMFHPTAEPDPDRFYFVASGPQLQPSDIAAELDHLRHRGILQRLSEACIWDSSNLIRYRQPDSSTELLTSVIPIRTTAGCWVLTSTHTTSEFLNTSIGRPYWETREVRFAAAIYVVLAIMALLVAISIRLSLRRFRDVAADISQGRIGDYAFSHRNVVPELSSVARDFDKLVLELARVSQQIRQSAEDKAHSFKTPLAAIRSALEPVRRAVPLDNVRARRALDIVDSSLHRLLDLVIAAQRLDISTAELIDSPRLPTDFTQLVADAALHFREILASKDVRLIRRLDEDAIVRAGRGMLEVVLQNVLENAISFAPRSSTIVVTLMAVGDTVELQVDDEGPGVPPEKIDHLFERYFSSRPRDSAEASAQATGHAGLGLWIVKRNVEALGGRVMAANRIGGGLCMTITLPRNRA
jgi:two-component system sensor histidine kinase ChvG